MHIRLSMKSVPICIKKGGNRVIKSKVDGKGETSPVLEEGSP